MVKDLSDVAPKEVTETAGDLEEESLDMQKVLDVQQHMQEAYYPNVEALSMNDKLLISTHALIHEAVEIERELNWKHWKKPVDINVENIKEEIVDAYIFLMNLINSTEMDASELFERTLNKIGINIERQKSGY